MRKRKLIAVLGIAVLGLTACAGTPDKTPTNPPKTSADPGNTAKPKDENPSLKDNEWVLTNGIVASLDGGFKPTPIAQEYMKGTITPADNLTLEWEGDSWVSVLARDLTGDDTGILDEYKETITTTDDYTLKGYYSTIAYFDEGVVQEKDSIAGSFHYVYIPKDPAGKYVFLDNIFNTENKDQEVPVDADNDGKADFEKHAEPLTLTLDKKQVMPTETKWSVSPVDYSRIPTLGASPLIYDNGNWTEVFDPKTPTVTTLNAKNGETITIHYANENATETARLQKLSLGDQPLQAGAFFNLVETKDGFDTYAVSYISSALMDTAATPEYSSLVMEYRVQEKTNAQVVQDNIQSFYATPFNS